MIQFLAGSTSQSIDVFIPDSGSASGVGKTGLVYNSAGLTAYYRKGSVGSPVAITLATLANAQAPWASGGFIEVDATNMPGQYRLDLPNAAIDAAGLVHLQLKGATGMVPVLLRLDCRHVLADVRQFGGTNGTFSGGVPAVSLTSAERTTLSGVLEGAMLNEADGQALLAAMQAQVQALFDSGVDVPVTTLVAAIRDGILNRVLAGNHDTSGTVGKVLQDTITAATLARQLVGNKQNVVDNGNGTHTISVRNDDDSATVRTIVYNPATGVRTVS